MKLVLATRCSAAAARGIIDPSVISQAPAESFAANQDRNPGLEMQELRSLRP